MEQIKDEIRIDDRMVEEARVRSLVRRGLIDPEKIDNLIA